MGLGAGTNNLVELLSLCYILYFALNKNCIYFQVVGDSKIVINWFNCISTCHAHTIRTILDDALYLKTHFDQITCSHIYKECNQLAYHRSKEATHYPIGEWLIREHR